MSNGQGRLDEAIGEYQAAMGVDSDYAKAHYNLGTIYYKQERLNEAARVVD